MPDLDALFSPRSIALVGASPDPHVIRGRMVTAVLDSGYPGTVYAISRSQRAIRGLACYRSVADLPEAVDLAIVTVPARYVGDVLEACGARGTRAAVIISSGFAEERGAEGRARQERITVLAEHYDMAVLGPNGEGFLNAALPLHASFSPVLVEGDLPSPPGKRARGVGVISQSGGIGFSFYDRGHPRCLPFSYVVSTGNEAGLSTLDVLEHLISDAATGVVMMFVEGFKGAQRFAPIAARAARARKPIIVTKVGRSDAAARAAVSHTASITGSHSAYEAMFRAHGVLSFPDADRMLDAAAALSYFHDRLPRGRRTAVLTASGGAGIWAADACVDAGLEVGPIDDATRVRLGENLPSYASTANPVDLTAQGLFDHGYAKPLEVLAASDTVDAVVVTCSMVRSDLITSDLDDLKRLGATCDKPIAFCAYTRANPEAVRALAAANFPCFASGHHAAAALAALFEYREFLDRAARDAALPVTPTTESSAEVHDALARAGDVLCEWEARGVLAAGGVAEPLGTLVADANQAVAAASEIGAPVALKVQSGAIVHKSDAGCVALGLEGDDAVARGYRSVLENAVRYAPGAEIAGVLVQPMAGAGVEMLLGTRRDENFGPMLVMGFGGALVEVVRDRVETPVPVSPGRCRELVDRLAVRALLDGVRGAPAADVDALVELACRLSRFAHAHADLVEEIDLNPVLVHPRGKGVSIADALVVKRKIPRALPVARTHTRPTSMSENDAAGDISVSVGAHVATVEIHRPPNNFFDFWLMRALADVYESLDDDPECRAIVLCSEGKHFCAGANLQARETWSEELLESQAGELYVEAVRLFRAGKPVVAAVQGAAVGGGLGLALSADFRVTCEEARFSANFSRLGFHQGFGLSVTLPRLIGAAQAELLLLTGRRVNGTEAYRLGLAEDLVPLERVRERALELAGEIAHSAPLAVQAIRATQRGGLAEEIARATDHELAEQSRLRRSEDFAEGVKAMGERRRPRFTGR